VEKPWSEPASSRRTFLPLLGEWGRGEGQPHNPRRAIRRPEASLSRFEQSSSLASFHGDESLHEIPHRPATILPGHFRLRKTGSAAARQLRRPAGEFWQREYLDRYVRNAEHYASVLAYIEENPVKAGLANIKTDWPWSSARFRAAGSAVILPARPDKTLRFRAQRFSRLQFPIHATIPADVREQIHRRSGADTSDTHGRFPRPGLG